MANLQRGLGAALGTFARVLQSSRAQRADEERRQAEEEARRKEAAQRGFTNIVGTSPTTSGQAAGIVNQLQQPDFAGVPGQREQVQRFQQEEQRLGRGEGREVLNDALERVRNGERIADIFPGAASSVIEEQTGFLAPEERDEAKLGLLQQQVRTGEAEQAAEAQAVVDESRKTAEEERRVTDQELQEEAAELARSREAREQARFEERDGLAEDPGERGQQRLRDAILSVGGVTGGLFSREVIAKAAAGETITIDDLPDERTAQLMTLTMTLADDILARDPDPFRPLDASVYEQAFTEAQAVMEVIDRIGGAEPSGFSARDRINQDIAAKVDREEKLSDTEQRIWNLLTPEDRARARGGG